MSHEPKGHGKFREIQFDNKFGIKDQFVINEAEALLTTLAAAEGVPTGNFDTSHLKAIHKHLLGDLYEWAGEFRETGITVGNNLRPSPSTPALVEGDTARVLKQISEERFESMSRVEFADKMASYYTRLYAISPFPDGNARTARAFIDALASSHDMQIEWGAYPGDAFNSAVEAGVQGNQNKLKALMRQMVSPVDLFELHNVEAIKLRSNKIIQTAGLNAQLIPSADMSSAADIAKLARHAKLEIMRSLEQYASSGVAFNRDWDQTSIHHNQTNTADRMRGSEVLRDVLSNMENSGVKGPSLRGPS